MRKRALVISINTVRDASGSGHYSLYSEKAIQTLGPSSTALYRICQFFISASAVAELLCTHRTIEYYLDPSYANT